MDRTATLYFMQTAWTHGTTSGKAMATFGDGPVHDRVALGTIMVEQRAIKVEQDHVP